MNQDIFYNTLGVIGACMVLFGFYRVNVGRWNNKSFYYELDNVVGSVLIVVYQIKYHAFVTVVVNIIWAGVALWGMLAFLHRTHHHIRKISKRKRRA